MKIKLALALAITLLSAPVSAEVLATMENNAGGKIVLTTLAPKACDGSYAAYTSNPKGKTLYGCWYADDEFVHITWADNGETMSYPTGSFVMRKTSPKT